MSFYFLLLLVFGGDIWSWKKLTQTKARTGLKDQPLPGAMATKAQHSDATDQQPPPGSFWGHRRLGDTASSAPFSSVSRKLPCSVCFLLTFFICFISFSTLHIRLPLVSSSKALPLWEMGMPGLAGGLGRTHLHIQGHAWRAPTLPSREKDMEKSSQHWQPVPSKREQPR